MASEVDSQTWSAWGKQTIRSWVKRYLFPDFTKWMTKYIVFAGIAIIITPDAIQYVMADWLITSLNLSAEGSLTLADFQASNSDYWAGIGLVAVALIHNIGYKWLESLDIKQKAQLARKKRLSDSDLFADLQKLLPSNGNAVRLLQYHDFHNSFRLDSVRPLEQFINDWNVPERRFHDEELDGGRDKLLASSRKFNGLLCSKSGPRGVDRQAVIPDRCSNDWDLPADVQQDVDDVNQAASETFDAHQKLITLAKSKLGC